MLKKTLSFSLLLLLTLLPLGAQELTDKLPVDPDLRIGTLDNGARYYVRANKKDPERANFHIVYNVGALQEDDSQDGLAHFLEHMAFNGSKNFPENQLIDYLQTIGIGYGNNLNAATAQQFTTYMITHVPLIRESITDSLLLVLHDWAGQITLADKAIDKERGVIREELRTRNTAGTRMMYKSALTVFGENSIVAQRNVIGTDEQLANFSSDQIRNFYHKWYRPDLHAFIIVGDFDPDEMVAKLKATMADIKPFEEQTPKEKITVDFNEQPNIGINSDPELTSYSLELIIKDKGIAESDNDTYLAAKMSMVEDIHYMIMKERISEIVESGKAPFYGARSYRYDLTDMYGFPIDGYDMSYGRVTYDYGKDLEAFEGLLTEMYRTQRHGFTQSEFDRAIANLRSSAESRMQGSGDRSNSEYVDDYETNYLCNTPIYGAEDEYNISMNLIENLTLEEVNSIVSTWMDESGWNINVNVPTKDGEDLVAKEGILASIAKVRDSEISAPENVEFSGSLITQDLKGSKVIKTEDGEYESIVWTLENGIKVVFKSSNLDPTELSLISSQKGGTSRLTDYADLANARYYDNIVSNFGVGDFSATNLEKMLSGKDVYAAPYIGSTDHGYMADCLPRDAEEMFQLLYLTATAPRYDQTVFGVVKERMNSALNNLEGTPDYESYKLLNKTIFKDPQREMQLSQQILDDITLDGLASTYDRYFSSSKDMVFVIIGNIEPADLKPLVEKYIGSLPVSGATPTKGENFDDYRSGEVKETFSLTMENPKVTSTTIYSGKWDYSVKQNIMLNMIKEILTIRYDSSIREDQGGTYGVGCSLEVDAPRGTFAQLMQFDTEDSKIETLQPLIYKEIENLISKGPSSKDLNKIKNNYKKVYLGLQNDNLFWQEQMEDYYFSGYNMYENYIETLESVTAEDIRQMAKALFSQGNLINVIIRPTK